MRGDGFALLSRQDTVTDTATMQLRQPSRHDADTFREDMARTASVPHDRLRGVCLRLVEKAARCRIVVVCVTVSCRDSWAEPAHRDKLTHTM